VKFLRPIGIVLLFWLIIGTILSIVLPWNIQGGSGTGYVSYTPVWPGFMFFIGLVVAIRDYRQHNRVSYPSPAAGVATPGSSAPTDTVANLQGLADLRDRGAITAEEYEAKKAELLSRL